MSAFQEQMYENFIYNNDPDLVHNLWLLAKNGKNINKIEPVYFQGLFNVATDPSIDIFPAIANVAYSIGNHYLSRYSTSFTGIPQITFYDVLTGIVTSVVSPQSSAGLTLANNLFMNQRLGALVSRVRWEDNAATVGTYAVLFKGYKIYYI